MRSFRRHLASAVLVAFAAAQRVRAQEEGASEGVFGARAEAEAPVASTNPLDETAAGTVASARDRAAAGTPLHELLEEVPGTHVAQTGGQGAFAAVALRGAALAQTTYLLGDLPLSGPDTGALDLSLFPLGAFEGVEVYRGGAPAWLGAGAIGGVVRLLPRAARRSSLGLTLTGGSFGSWRMVADSAVSRGPLSLVGSVGLDGAENDYPYRFDNATLFDPSDDDERRRRNAQTLGAHGLVHLRAEVGEEGRLDAVVLGVSRRGGAPGPGASSALKASLSRARLLGNVGYVQRFARGRLQLAAGGGVERRRFLDRFGEIGLGFQDTDDRIGDVALRAAGELTVARWLDLTVVGVARWDSYRPENLLGREAGDSTRWTLSGTTELRAHGKLGRWRFALRPSVRVEHARTEALGLRHNIEQRYASELTRPTGRLGVLLAPHHAVSFVGSIASGSRFPSIWELFGDRAAIEPSPDLKPERGRSADVGVVARGAAGALSATLELRWFRLDMAHFIRPRPLSQETVKYENAEGAQVRGLEAGSQGRVGEYLRWVGTLTWIRSEHLGSELNWRPRLRAMGRVELRSGPLGPFRDLVAFTALVHRGRYYDDPANLVSVRGASWLSAGVRADLDWGLSMLFTARDLFDRRGQDYVGYPLPGRRYAFSIRWRMEL